MGEAAESGEGRGRRWARGRRACAQVWSCVRFNIGSKVIFLLYLYFYETEYGTIKDIKYSRLPFTFTHTD